MSVSDAVLWQDIFEGSNGGLPAMLRTARARWDESPERSAEASVNVAALCVAQLVMACAELGRDALPPPPPPDFSDLGPEAARADEVAAHAWNLIGGSIAAGDMGVYDDTLPHRMVELATEYEELFVFVCTYLGYVCLMVLAELSEDDQADFGGAVNAICAEVGVPPAYPVDVAISVESCLDNKTLQRCGPEGVLHAFMSTHTLERGDRVTLPDGTVRPVVASNIARSGGTITQTVFIDLL